MAVLETAYPMFYAKKTQQEREDAIKLWAEMFADEPGEVVAMATKALIKSRVSTFPPGIGEITEKIQQIMQPDQMTELEAWGLVVKAVSNSTYNSGEEFKKLPPVVQRLVGAPSQLKEWAAMDSETLNSVVASNFQRSYKVRAKNERDYLALPSSVKSFMAGITDGMRMPALPEGEITEDKRMDAIRRLREL
jgi:hypothetical protein